MTTEQNYYIAFHSVIVVDMEKERKKLSKMFVAKIKCFHCPACVTAPTFKRNNRKKKFFGGRGERKRKTRLGQHPVAACPPEPGNNHHQKKKEKFHTLHPHHPTTHITPSVSRPFPFFLFSFFLFRERTNELEKVAEKIDRETFSFSIPKKRKESKE
jgi:hypothetical protein